MVVYEHLDVAKMAGKKAAESEAGSSGRRRLRS